MGETADYRPQTADFLGRIYSRFHWLFLVHGVRTPAVDSGDESPHSIFRSAGGAREGRVPHRPRCCKGSAVCSLRSGVRGLVTALFRGTGHAVRWANSLFFAGEYVGGGDGRGDCRLQTVDCRPFNSD